MPTQNIHVLTGVVSLEELCEVVAKLQKQVRYLQNKGIDSENTREIGGWQVSEDTLQALDGDVGLSTADDAPDPVRLWAGSVSKDAAPWRVHKSGFGVATGWRIQSKGGTYPYVVMDPEDDLFGAYASASSYIVIGAYDNIARPYMDFGDGGLKTRLNYSSGAGFTIDSPDYIDLDSPHVYLYTTTHIQNWVDIFNDAAGESLQDVFDSKANYGSQTSIVNGGAHNHGIPDGTVLRKADGGTVTWSAYAGFTHSHTQL